MPDVYLVTPNAPPVALTRVHTKDEAAELQRLLTSNPNLLPSDQISPDDPCRWLLVGAEVPVPDPATGSDRWSIDVVFVDQNAIPTFVECKRFLNTQSRREIVGQMLEYAANGHYYWTAESLRGLAAKTAAAAGTTLDARLAAVSPEGGTLDFFERVENNLREGQIRMVFFLEEAPPELKSIVEFLNRQMERAEVLIVEAHLFETDGKRFIVPALFGYSEQARMAKRSVTVNLPGRRVWTEELYFADVEARLDPSSREGLLRLFRFLQSVGCAFRWGSGRVHGSFSAVPPLLERKSLLTAYSNGDVVFNLAHMTGTAELDGRRQRLVDGLNTLGATISPEQARGYVTLGTTQLAPKMPEIETLISQVVS